MNLLEAKKKLLENGYELHALNECGGVYYGSEFGYYGCGYGYIHEPKPKKPYKKDSELTPAELERREAERELKSQNKSTKNMIRKKLEIFASSIDEFTMKDIDLLIKTSGSRDSIKGSIEIPIRNGTGLKMTKYIDGKNYFEFVSSEVSISSDDVMTCVNNADKIKSVIAKFKKLKF